MIYTVSNIIWDNGDHLPTQMEVDVPSYVESSYDKVEFISDYITNTTGYCHCGFSLTPEIEET